MVSDVFFPRVNGVSTSIQTFRRDLAALGCETLARHAGISAEAGRRRRARAAPAVALSRVRPRRSNDETARDARSVHRSSPGASTCCTFKRRSSRTGSGSTPRAIGRADRSRRITRSSKSICITTCRCCRPAVARAFARASRGGSATPSTRWSRRRSSSPTCSSATASAPPIHTIPTGLNLDEFTGGDGAAFRAQHGIAPDRPVMLLVGRVAHEKNIDFLLARARGGHASRARTCCS